MKFKKNIRKSKKKLNKKRIKSKKGGNNNYKYFEKKINKVYNKKFGKQILKYIRKNVKNKNFKIKNKKIYIVNQNGGNTGLIVGLIIGSIALIGLFGSGYGYAKYQENKEKVYEERIINQKTKLKESYGDNIFETTVPR